MRKLCFLLILFCFNANAQFVNIPDANFKNALLASTTINTNSNNEIEISEAQNYTQILSLSNLNISSLTGIEYFTNISGLYVAYNNLTTLDLSNNNGLEYTLDCSNNQISNLVLPNNSGIRFIYCQNNQLTNLNVANQLQLAELDCYNNGMVSLNISNLPNITDIDCSRNQFTSLNFSNLSLINLNCYDNQLTSLIVSNCPNVFEINCHSNLLTTLDVSGLPSMAFLNCYDNQLTSLFLKNGRDEILIYHENPNLQYICADEVQISEILNFLSQSGMSNCQVNSYCSFVPGGNYYTINGSSKFDIDNNGCGVSDSPFSSLKFNLTNGAITGSVFPAASGSYSIPVQAGTHTMTPVVENPGYFTISPPNAVITFPAQASPFTQNFCITANGNHPDLEITLLPLQPARPGFDATYKLICKNKGNTMQSGNVNFAFNDIVLDFVSSNPVSSNQTVNNLSWTFTNLLPFETREIAITLNVNSPMETPAVNIGDVLNFTATIVSAATDDTPNDNIFPFHQVVVGAYDPNDKTCLEGNSIAPAKVGDYVHYMIRFENTGTFPAQNIVVKDMIDTAKFDINSLVPIKGSHSFVTKIASGNKVEFIFENINLPFDNANNDGYVAFKIKTKPTLVLGNTFSNTASIYFDYNFPIVTNTATTTIQTLSRQDFEFSSYFSLYPNPVNTNLNIAAKETIKITSIAIYNTLGQLLLTIPNAENTKTIDVSGLTSGNYFIKINSDQGTANTKFIKK